MATIQVDQAVFTSTDKRSVQGYQLVARSSGIDDRAASALCQWSPTHGSLFSDHPEASSLNFFPIDQGRVAVGRTVYGLSEYSSRGGLQVLTSFLVTTLDHLRQYEGDAWSLAMVARSMGHLRFTSTLRSSLPQIELPASYNLVCPPSQSKKPLAEKAVELLRRGRRVAILGLRDPFPTLREIVLSHEPQERPSLSFSTGLQNSSQRKFRLQFFESVSVELRSELSQHEIYPLKYEPDPAAPNANSEALNGSGAGRLCLS